MWNFLYLFPFLKAHKIKQIFLRSCLYSTMKTVWSYKCLNSPKKSYEDPHVFEINAIITLLEVNHHPPLITNFVPISHFFNNFQYSPANMKNNWQNKVFTMFSSQKLNDLVENAIVCKIYWEFTRFHRKSWSEVKV